MKKVLFCLFAVLVCAGGFAQEKIAVFPFEDLSNVFSQTEMTFFYRRFSNEFTNRNAGRFIIVPRTDVDRLINTEMAFQLSDFSAREKTAEMNRVLNGTQILSGLIGRIGSRITVSVSLYTYPELSQLPGGVDLTVTNADELFDKIPELVQNMQDNIGTGPRPPDENRTYQIGDYGPAGGIVFYDKGVFSGGWRYLEAAPAGTEINGVQWGAFTASGGSYNYRDIPGTGTTVGSGKRNTELIVERLRAWNETDRAAQLCASLNFDGYADWFLPSKDELDLMYRNLKQKGVGDFGDQYYWSSSQESNRNAWNQGFNFGRQDYELGLKNIRYSVRAVRAF